MIKLIIAGGRTYSNYRELQQEIDEFQETYGKIDQIICGEARGADHLGKCYAEDNEIPVISFPANWDEYGKRAGYLRNVEMAKYATHCICFWDSKSVGTKMMIDIAKEYNLFLKVVIIGR